MNVVVERGSMKAWSQGGRKRSMKMRRKKGQKRNKGAEGGNDRTRNKVERK